MIAIDILAEEMARIYERKSDGSLGGTVHQKGEKERKKRWRMQDKDSSSPLFVYGDGIKYNTTNAWDFTIRGN